MDFAALGRPLVVVGLVLTAVGLALLFADRVPFVGRLPGDVEIRGDRWTVYAPLATSLLMSVALTAALMLLAWLGRR